MERSLPGVPALSWPRVGGRVEAWLRHRTAWIAVLGLLTATVGIRAAGMPGSGLVFYDEGRAALLGRQLIAIFGRPNLADFGSWLAHGDQKPLHDFLLGITLAGGAAPDALPWLSGVAGLVMVAGVAALVGRRWGAPAAAVAGVFAGSLPLGIIYGHRILGEGDSLAALALALLAWDRAWEAPKSERLAAAALLAFTATLLMNYRFLPAIAPLLLALAWRRRRLSGPGLILLCLAPGAAFVVLYLLAVLVGHLLGDLPAYARLLVRSGSGAPVPFQALGFYPRTFWEFGGPAFAAALLAGAVAVVRARLRLTALDAVAVGTVLGSVLLFSTVHDKAPRALAICIPFAAVVAARAVTLVRGRMRQWSLALGICAICLLNAWAGSSPARDLSGTRAAGRWLAARPGAVAAERPQVVAIYVASDRRVVEARDFTSVAQLRAAGVRWVMVEGQSWVWPIETVSKRLAACAQPVVEFDDPAGVGRSFFLENADTLHLGYQETLTVREEALRATGGKIRIYDTQGAGTAACG